MLFPKYITFFKYLETDKMQHFKYGDGKKKPRVESRGKNLHIFLKNNKLYVFISGKNEYG